MNPDSKKSFSWKKAILLCLILGLLTAGLSVLFQSKSILTLSTPEATGSGSSYEATAEPVRLLIPAIGVDAVVQSVGLSSKGTGDMGIPTNFTDVAWYNKGPNPGNPGSAVVAGHLDGRNTPKAVFFSLEDLKPGDLVEVVDKAGKRVQFRVVRSQTFDSEAPTEEVFVGDPEKTMLNLITCTGSWDPTSRLYNKRIVVFTELVKD